MKFLFTKIYDMNYNDIHSARKDINYSGIRMSQFVIVMSQFVIVMSQFVIVMSQFVIVRVGFYMYFNSL